MISEGITGLNILPKQLCYFSNSLHTETYRGGSTSFKFSLEELQHPIPHPPPPPQKKIPPPMLRRKAHILIHFSLIHASCFGFLILTALDYSFNSITRETKTFLAFFTLWFSFFSFHMVLECVWTHHTWAVYNDNLYRFAIHINTETNKYICFFVKMTTGVNK